MTYLINSDRHGFSHPRDEDSCSKTELKVYVVTPTTTFSCNLSGMESKEHAVPSTDTMDVY